MQWPYHRSPIKPKSSFHISIFFFLKFEERQKKWYLTDLIFLKFQPFRIFLKLAKNRSKSGFKKIPAGIKNEIRGWNFAQAIFLCVLSLKKSLTKSTTPTRTLLKKNTGTTHIYIANSHLERPGVTFRRTEVVWRKERRKTLES